MSDLQYPLYKRATDGSIQVWQQEIEGDSYRTHSGQINGKIVVSAWKQAKPKNVGKANATTAEQQAVIEVAANYKKRMELNYTPVVTDIDNDFFFQPMLAKGYEKYPINWERQTVYCQPKLDGMRCIITRKGAFSRKGKPIVSIPHIMEELEMVFVAHPDLVLDGELYNHKFKDDFNEIMSIVKQTKPTQDDLDKSREYAQFHMYDIGSNKPFDDRIDDVWDIMDVYSDLKYIHMVETHWVATQYQLDSYYDTFIEQGYEGQMVRISADGYENARSKNLLKRKEFDDYEFEIISVEPGKGNRAHVAGSIRCRLPDGREFGAGVKGSFAYAEQLLKDRDKYVGGEVTVQFFKYTPDGIPRFPVAKALFEGKREL